MQGVDQEAEDALPFLFGVSPLSLHLSSEASEKRKQKGRKDKEEPTVLRASSKEPPRTELQPGSPKEPADFNPAAHSSKHGSSVEER